MPRGGIPVAHILTRAEDGPVMLSEAKHLGPYILARAERGPGTWNLQEGITDFRMLTLAVNAGVVALNVMPLHGWVFHG